MSFNDPYSPSAIRDDLESNPGGGKGALLWFLGGGFSAFLSCAFFAYLMLLVIPELKKSYYDRGAALPGPTILLIQIADVAISYWHLWTIPLLGAGLWIELFLPPHKRASARKRLGIGLSVFAFVSGVFTLFAVCLAM